jgi:hypothetical protein
MSSAHWSDRDLRAFVQLAPRLEWGDAELADLERRNFCAQLLVRVVPTVRERVLASVGIVTAPEGIALFACELIEDGRYDRRRDALLLSTDPWLQLTDWLSLEVLRSCRATMKARKKDAAALEGIAAASSRLELDGPFAE